MCSFNSPRVLPFFFLHVVYLSSVSREKQSHAKRSGDLTGQMMSQKFKMMCPGDMDVKQFINPCAVCCDTVLLQQELTIDIKIIQL
jgi:hypothetical protein